MKIPETWLGLEDLLLNKVTQIQTDKNYVVCLLCMFENVIMIHETFYDDFEKNITSAWKIKWTVKLLLRNRKVLM